jgi:hypothetical protein
MLRPSAVRSIAFLCLGASACEGLVGSVDVSPAPRRETTPAEDDSVAPAQPLTPVTPSTPVGEGPDRPIVGPGAVAPLPVAGAVDAGLSPVADAGVAPVDSGPPAPVIPDPRPVLVEGPASALDRIGVDGGGPRLGVCDGGFVIGVRPTANPSDQFGGLRLTFVEPICGTAISNPARLLGLSTEPRIAVIRNDAILAWNETGDFLGLPSIEPPDPALVWDEQPETLCPEAAPALVGFVGEYDPSAPDSEGTAAIRSLAIECAPLLVDDTGLNVFAADSGHQVVLNLDSFAAEGTDNYDSSCGDGAVVTDVLVHSGYWLDGFELGCSSLRSPNVEGEPCSEGRDCQNGSCSDVGTCAP